MYFALIDLNNSASVEISDAKQAWLASGFSILHLISLGLLI